MTELVYALAAFVCALISCGAALRAAGPRSLARKLRSLQSSFDTLQADYSELLEILKRLDARDKMRSVRAGREPESSAPTTPRKRMNGRPDPITDPNAWKAWMRESNPTVGVHKPPQE